MNLRLETERLVLRELLPEDFEAIHAYASDEEVSRFEAWGPNEPEDTGAYLRRVLDERNADVRTKWTLGVTEQGRERRVLGTCGIWIEDPGSRCAWMGYVLHPSVWGRGYATEAATAVMRLGFRRLGIHRIAATCREENAGSARVLEKLGMRLEGRMRQDAMVRGRYMDSRLYARLAGD